MAYRLYNTKQGAFSIDWDTCCHIIRSYHRSDFQLRYAREERESQVSLIDPRSWGMPDLVMVTVDWLRVQEEAKSATLLSAHGMAARAIFESNGIDQMVDTLRSMQRKTRSNIAAFQRMQQTAARKASEEIEAAVSMGERGQGVAKTIRDMSASFLVGLGSVASGGTATAILGLSAGSVLKGTAKYQDAEQNAEIGTFLEVSQTVVTNAFTMGKGVKILVNVVMDGSKAYADGNSVLTSIGVGTVNVVTGPMGDKAKDTLKKIFAVAAVPGIVKVGQDLIKKKGQSLVKEIGQGSESSSGTEFGRGSALMESLAFEESMLLKLAVVDMQKGIGNSWW